MRRERWRQVLALRLLEHGVLVLEPGEGGADLGLDGAIVALRLRGSELKRLRQALRNRLAEEAARVLGQRRRGKERRS